MATYYVAATGGSDSNAGTTTAGAFATISKGCITAFAGDTVVCLSGTYNGGIYINTTNMRSGTTAAPITLMSVTPLAAMFKALAAPATGGGNHALLECRANCWKIHGFEFNGLGGYTFDGAGNATWALGGAGQYTIGCFYSGLGGIIENNYIHHTCQADPGGNGGSGAQAEGFYTGYAVSGVHIRYNHVHHTASSVTGNKSHGIYLTTSECYVYGNLVHNQFGGCLFHGWHGFTGGYCANNTVFNGQDVGILFGQGDGGSSSGVANFKCFNNIVQNITGVSTCLGIADFGGPPSYPAFGAGNVIRNNMTQGCTKAYSLTSTIASSFSRSGPVAFVNYLDDGTGDYHLSATSPAINLGISSLSGYNAPTLDIDGQTRPQGAAIDLGAYEFVSTSGDTTPPTYSSAVVQNATPTQIVITMSEALTNEALTIGSFNVGRTINSITVSGSTITIVVAVAFVFGDVIRVTYTKPASAPWIEDLANNPAASFGPNTVTNNVASNIPPVGEVGTPNFGGHDRRFIFNQ